MNLCSCSVIPYFSYLLWNQIIVFITAEVYSCYLKPGKLFQWSCRTLTDRSRHISSLLIFSLPHPGIFHECRTGHAFTPFTPFYSWNKCDSSVTEKFLETRNPGPRTPVIAGLGVFYVLLYTVHLHAHYYSSQNNKMLVVATQGRD